MSTYQSLATIARNLKVSESDLLDLEQQGWINSAAKNGNFFLSGRDAFKARFIFHLRRLQLTNDVDPDESSTQDPPYSLAEIPQILGRPVPLR